MEGQKQVISLESPEKPMFFIFLFLFFVIGSVGTIWFHLNRYESVSVSNST